MPTSDPSLAISLRGVTKTYGSHVAVRDLSIDVPYGSIYGFIGPNGSGKTTTIRMILHIIQADEGRISVLGETGSRAANDRIGYLPEERGLYKKMKVSSLLQYYGTLKGMPAKQARTEGLRWLEKMDLAPWASKKIEALSKGMAQKVQFIATVLSRPKLLILDEPYSGLDPVNLETIREAVLELREAGTTIIFSTHDMSMAERMCDSVFMIYKGSKVLDGSLREIKEQYGQDAVRVKIEGGLDTLHALPQVKSARPVDDQFEAELQGDHQDFLRALVQATAVEQFERVRPSLHDIFLKIARPQKTDKEAIHV